MGSTPATVPTVREEPRQVARLNVVNELRELILGGEFSHGEWIRQEEIAERFQLSRIPVREALRTLEAEGLVIIQPRRGARVASVDRFELEQIYTLRIAVEPLAISQSISQLTEEHILELEELAARMESSTDIEEFLATDREFHLMSYQGAQYPLITQLVERFWNTTQHYRRRYALVRSDRSFQHAYSDHRLLIQAIRDGNGDVAAAIVKHHIERTRDDLLATLDEVDGTAQNLKR
ncbi:GntR family transcriptional regulator [Leucobacter sp. W1038]|uniref:GntR family transcriptional regulator n=1 Tax=Leucobacter sp. W1038 TaxID=3438281 RepID=UPI003D99A5BE